MLITLVVGVRSIRGDGRYIEGRVEGRVRD